MIIEGDFIMTENLNIKEKLLKGCGKPEERYGTTINCGYLLKDNKTINLCSNCKAKLQQHEETSKAKDEEFIKILEELQDLILKDGVYEIETEKHLAGLVDIKKVFNRFVEIKQRIKENEE